MQFLQEKPEKMQRRLKTFEKFLSDNSGKIKHSKFAQEIGTEWSSIQKYLKETEVSFEFECYLNCADHTQFNYTAYMLDTIDLNDISARNVSFLEEYFPEEMNGYAWDSLNEKYWSFVDDVVSDRMDEELEAMEREHQENQEDLPDDEKTEFDRYQIRDEIFERVEEEVKEENTLEDWLWDNFRTIYRVVQKFSFDHPLYGFVEDDQDIIHRTEESQLSESDEEETLREEYRLDAYKNIKLRIKEVFADAKVKVSATYHGTPTNFKIENPHYWFVEHDGSLKKYDKDYEKVPVEIISPRVSAKDAISVLETFKKEIYDHFEGETDNQNVGCHINISFPNRLDVDPIKLIVMADADRWATKFNRKFSVYAKSQQEKFKSILQNQKNRSFEEMINDLKDNVQKDKMMDINFLKTNMIEFRFPGNEYFDKYYEDLLETIKWLLYAMTVATHSEFHKQEYMYRVFQLTKPSETESTNPLKTILMNYLSPFKYKKDGDFLSFFNNLKLLQKRNKVKRYLTTNFLQKMKEEELVKSVANKASTTTIEEVAAVSLGTDERNLLKAKIQSDKTQIPLDDVTQMNFENNYNAVISFEAYKYAKIIFSYLKLPVTK